MGAALVAGLNQEPGVGAHKGHCHGHLCSIWQGKTIVLAAFFDKAKYIVPATGIETGSVFF